VNAVRVMATVSYLSGAKG